MNKEFGDRTLLKAVKFNKGENQTVCVYNPVNCFLEKVFVEIDNIIYTDNQYNEKIELLTFKSTYFLLKYLQ
ncbi:hypothetical protein AEA09_06140 [Lysinibacillus contaminans]|uniref:Uncharacterized protein n=1 Tax=Lysinibacillus contaminans TaxID=1293441 RepID=A0ABR5JZV1_9BACI|nr:hypothetical protein AEA09_06140 [Lysinibacillus contaminans]